MPLYEYECGMCGDKVELLQPSHSALPPLCDMPILSPGGNDLGQCHGGAMQKVPSTFAPHDTMMLHHPGGTTHMHIPRKGGKGTHVYVSGGRQ